MRKIEKGMVEAIRERHNYRCGNTAVLVRSASAWCQVMLHENCIAEVHDRDIVFTLAGWGTATTRSRINVILQEFAPPGWRVIQRDHKQLVCYPDGGEDLLTVGAWWRAPRV